MVRERLAELLSHPLGCRIRRDVEMDDPSSSVVDDKPDVQQLKAHRGDDAEVHDRDNILMVLEKGHPALSLSLIRRPPWQIPRDGCETYGKSELLKFGVNLACSPTILQGETTNEGLHFLRHPRSPRAALRDPSPIESESLVMPTDHRVRLDNDQDLFPSRPEPEQRHPESAIERREPGLRSRLGVGCELLPQGQFDDCLLIAASEEGERRAKEHSQEIEQSLHREREAAPFPHSGTG